ncbi:MAG: methyl-accepting chemotaxis protein [Gammaproteobacteria bacterium]
MKVKTSILSLPAISAVIFVIGLAVSSYLSTHALGTIEQTGEIDYPALSQANELRGEAQGIADSLRDAVAEGDKARLASVEQRFAAMGAKVREFGKLPGRDKDAQLLLARLGQYQQHASRATRILLEMEEGDPGEAIPKMQSAWSALSAATEQTVNSSKARFKAGIIASADGVRMSLVTSVVVAAIIMVALVAVSLFVVRAIWRQLGGEPEYARTIARAVAGGDLSIAIDTQPGQQGSLLGALAEMRARLCSIVADIQHSAEEIKVASSDIADGNADLSARTEDQASNLGNAAHSMSELTSAVQRNAETAQHATELANVASSVAQKGGQAVRQVVATMDDINTSARKIADIISVIDGIAFQTNILALNAAVESARAGEHGRGFAVVASEVRSLAQRSATAAKEIKDLIGDAVGKVGNGSAMVQDAGRTMDEIVASVQQVTQLVHQISTSSTEQSASLEELSRGVNDMDDSTRRNAAVTEQAASAAASLQEQALQLSRAVQVFKLAAAAAPRKAPAWALIASR